MTTNKTLYAVAIAIFLLGLALGYASGVRQTLRLMKGGNFSGAPAATPAPATTVPGYKNPFSVYKNPFR